MLNGQSSLLEMESYLKSHVLSKESKDKPTHVCFGDFKRGRYQIPNNEEFLNIYNSTTDNKCILECPLDVCIFVLDFDWVTLKRQYTFELLTKMCEIINDVIKCECDGVIDKKYLDCHIHEKKTITKTDNGFKDGLHFMYPNLFMNKRDRVQLTLDIKTKFTELCNIFIDIHPNFGESIDKQVTHNNFYLYGSSKPNRTPYYLTHILRIATDGTIKQRKSLPSNDDLVFLYSMRFEHSINYKHVVPKSAKVQQYTKTSGEIEHHITEHHIAHIDKLLTCLGSYRSDDYGEWINVGLTLHGMSPGLLQSWITFSKRSDKFIDDRDCITRWNSFTSPRTTIGINLIHLWVKQDNQLFTCEKRPTSFMKEYIKDNLKHSKDILLQGLSGCTYDLACVIHTLYKNEYVCTHVTSNTWYQFNGYRWILNENAFNLSIEISQTVSLYYSMLRIECQQDQLDTDEEEGDKDKIKKLNKVIMKLKDCNFKDTLIKECKGLFYDDCFYSKLDTRPELLCFNNGVYDFNLKHFRKARPDDYISLTTDMPYLEYTEDNEDVKYLEEYFRKVQPDDELRMFLLQVLSSTLIGGNSRQRFNIFTGIGSNGKSTTMALHERLLGQYYLPVQSNIITQSRGNANQASPLLAAMRGKRLVVINEVESKEVIQSSFMKDLTGGDRITARELYKAPFQFNPMFKFFLLCNKLPKLSTSDAATFRRIEVLPWNSRFIKTPVKDNEFALDEYVPTKLRKCVSAYAWLLINKYIVPEHSIQVPTQVKIRTNEFESDSNVFSEFMKLYTIESNENVNIRELFSIFESFHKENYSCTQPNKKEFIEYLSTKYIVDKTYVYNISIEESS